MLSWKVTGCQLAKAVCTRHLQVFQLCVPLVRPAWKVLCKRMDLKRTFPHKDIYRNTLKGDEASAIVYIMVEMAWCVWPEYL